MTVPPPPPNPFAPGATVDREGALTRPERPARWLALLSTVLCWYPLMGVGHFVMGRPLRWLTWITVGIVGLGLMLVGVRTSSPKLFVIAVVGMLLAILAGLVDVARIKAGFAPPPFRRALTIVILLFIAERLTGAATKEWLMEAFNIPSGAMVPNLWAGDHIMVKKGGDFGRGDIIVFKYPQDPAIDYVKRVIAVGGEIVEFQNGAIAINGRLLPQTAIPGDAACSAGAGHCSVSREENGARSYTILMDPDRRRGAFGPVTVPAGHVFVVGDNRDNSSDSRVWGSVPNANVKGTVSLIYWSDDKATGTRWNRVATVPQ